MKLYLDLITLVIKCIQNYITKTILCIHCKLRILGIAFCIIYSIPLLSREIPCDSLGIPR